MWGQWLIRFFSRGEQHPPAPLPPGASAILRETLQPHGITLPAAAIPLILQAVQRHNRIEAIRELREHADRRVGLKDAKEIIEDFERRLRSSRPF